MLRTSSPAPSPSPSPFACNMKRADGCKHHLYPARNNKNVLSFLSFTRQNQQNQCIVSQPQLCAPRRQIQNRLFCRVSQRVPQANAFFVQYFKTQCFLEQRSASHPIYVKPQTTCDGNTTQVHVMVGQCIRVIDAALAYTAFRFYIFQVGPKQQLASSVHLGAALGSGGAGAGQLRDRKWLKMLL
jgi:hypothetical protein